MADDDPSQTVFQPPNPQWSPDSHIYPHSHHGTPAQEYTGFHFGGPSQAVMESNVYGGPVQQQQQQHHQQHRTMHHQQLQPLIMPQWPSMLNTQSQSSSSSSSSYQPVPYGHVFPQSQHLPIAPLVTPISATSARSATTPRKTLTDLDRKRMCQYAEDHPNSKQTEIGGKCHGAKCDVEPFADGVIAIFGVERRSDGMRCRFVVFRRTDNALQHRLQGFATERKVFVPRRRESFTHQTRKGSLA